MKKKYLLPKGTPIERWNEDYQWWESFVTTKDAYYTNNDNPLGSRVEGVLHHIGTGKTIIVHLPLWTHPYTEIRFGPSDLIQLDGPLKVPLKLTNTRVNNEKISSTSRSTD
jgi:hypothetical protein